MNTRNPLLILPFLLVAISISSWAAERVSFGLKAGVPLNNAFATSDSHYEIETPRWTAGPTLELGVSGGFAVGVEALYRRISLSYGRSVGSASFFSDGATSHWELPVYAKYSLRSLPSRPFFEGGAAFGRGQTAGSYGCSGDPQLCFGSLSSGNTHSTDWGAGLLIGGGIEMNLGALTVAPELRYTRWLNGYFTQAFPNFTYPFGVRSQTEILIGFRF